MTFQLTFSSTGEEGVIPRYVNLLTSDDYSAVTTAGYLNAGNLQGNTIYPTDIIQTIYSYSQTNLTANFEFFSATVSNGIITLSAQANDGDVTLPVANNNFAIFGPTDTIVDEGYIPSDIINPSLTKKVCMATTGSSGSYAQFTDANGTISQGTGFQPTDPAQVIVASVLSNNSTTNNLPIFSDVNGSLADSGIRLFSGFTPSWGGGSTVTDYEITGLTENCKGGTIIVSSANAATVTSTLCGTDTMVVFFNVDPGAGTILSYVFTSNSIN